MEPHQERVVAEQNELNIKIGKLRIFLDGMTFQALASAEREWLRRQLDVMTAYSSILGERIEAFTPKN